MAHGLACRQSDPARAARPSGERRLVRLMPGLIRPGSSLFLFSLRCARWAAPRPRPCSPSSTTQAASSGQVGLGLGCARGGLWSVGSTSPRLLALRQRSRGRVQARWMSLSASVAFTVRHGPLTCRRVHHPAGPAGQVSCVIGPAAAKENGRISSIRPVGTHKNPSSVDAHRLLFPPPFRSGKSTFLQTLSGHNRRQRSLKARLQSWRASKHHTALNGSTSSRPPHLHPMRPSLTFVPPCLPSVQFQAQELSFNGHQFQEFVVERSAAYISQVGRRRSRVGWGCVAHSCSLLPSSPAAWPAGCNTCLALHV